MAFIVFIVLVDMWSQDAEEPLDNCKVTNQKVLAEESVLNSPINFYYLNKLGAKILI